MLLEEITGFRSSPKNLHSRIHSNRENRRIHTKDISFSQLPNGNIFFEVYLYNQN